MQVKRTLEILYCLYLLPVTEIIPNPNSSALIFSYNILASDSARVWRVGGQKRRQIKTEVGENVDKGGGGAGTKTEGGRREDNLAPVLAQTADLAESRIRATNQPTTLSVSAWPPSFLPSTSAPSLLCPSAKVDLWRFSLGFLAGAEAEQIFEARDLLK